MATQVFSGTATIGTTPFSLPNGSTTLTPITAADDIGAVVEFTSLAVGDRFQVEVLDKTASSGGTQRSLFKAVVQGPGTFSIATPFLALIHGWDVRVTKLAGTDRSVTWSLRKPG